MQHNAAFHLGLHCWLRSKQPSGLEIHHNLENSICNPLKITIGSLILSVSTHMEKSNRIQRVNGYVASSTKSHKLAHFLDKYKLAHFLDKYKLTNFLDMYNFVHFLDKYKFAHFLDKYKLAQFLD